LVLSDHTGTPVEPGSTVSTGAPQVGTTLNLNLLAVIRLDGGVRLEIDLKCSAQRKRKTSPTQVQYGSLRSPLVFLIEGEI